MQSLEPVGIKFLQTMSQESSTALRKPTQFMLKLLTKFLKRLDFQNNSGLGAIDQMEHGSSAPSKTTPKRTNTTWWLLRTIQVSDKLRLLRFKCHTISLMCIGLMDKNGLKPRPVSSATEKSKKCSPTRPNTAKWSYPKKFSPARSPLQNLPTTQKQRGQTLVSTRRPPSSKMMI